jgi:hypothetical protein
MANGEWRMTSGEEEQWTKDGGAGRKNGPMMNGEWRMTNDE